MEVGGLTETVQVTGASPIVDTAIDDDRRGARRARCSSASRSAAASATRCISRPASAAGGSVGTANPSISGGSGLENQYVVDGVNVTNQGYGALGSYSIVFGSLGNATPFDFMQGSPGQDRRLRGRVRPGDRRRGERRHQERHRTSCAGRCSATRGRRARRRLEAVPDRRTAPSTPSARSVSDVGVEAGGPIVKDRLFFFGAIDPSWETRTFARARRTSRCEPSDDVDRERRTTSYAAKGTWQLDSAHRVRRVVLRRSVEGRQRAAARSALLGNDTSASARSTTAATIRPSATTASCPATSCSRRPSRAR